MKGELEVNFVGLWSYSETSVIGSTWLGEREQRVIIEVRLSSNAIIAKYLAKVSEQFFKEKLDVGGVYIFPRHEGQDGEFDTFFIHLVEVKGNELAELSEQYKLLRRWEVRGNGNMEVVGKFRLAS